MRKSSADVYDIIGVYRSYIRHKELVILVIMLVTMGMALVAISAGSAGLSIGEVILSLFGQGSAKASRVIWNIRMPRVITAVVAGTGLAATGCVMQGLLKNPLASSSTLGVSQGAAFGASLAIICFGAGMQNQTLDGVTIHNPYLVSICAFVASMTATAVVLALSRFRRITPEAMVLCGVALSSLFSGGTTLIQYFADDVKVAAVVFWTFGDLGRTSWRELIIMLAVTVLALVYFILNRWNYNAMQSGEHTAKGLGVNVESLRMTGMIICSLCASVIVSFIGIINFIGLIAPHLMRRFVGSDYRYLLPASAVAGAFLLLLSDTAARLVVSPVILPIGAITSFFGAPMFLYLLFRGMKNR
jgi:iron complex transport system permease protein